ncbi:multi-sensor hybrid histidine kinase [Leptolyngbya sp. NIES-3755]|nr:multi-sensor hybrid histidine kinase [Leptolyngbya sp. NIES-3755]
MIQQISSQQPLRALVVDDDLDSVILMTTVLEIHGIDVTATMSAAQALQAISSLPHILIADLAMPFVDGFDLIRQVRNLPPNQGGEVPAIAVSAWVAVETQERAMNCGFQKFLAKPYPPSDLIDLVSQVTGWKVSEPEFAA